MTNNTRDVQRGALSFPHLQILVSIHAAETVDVSISTLEPEVPLPANAVDRH